MKVIHNQYQLFKGLNPTFLILITIVVGVSFPLIKTKTINPNNTNLLANNNLDNICGSEQILVGFTTEEPSVSVLPPPRNNNTNKSKILKEKKSKKNLLKKRMGGSRNKKNKKLDESTILSTNSRRISTILSTSSPTSSSPSSPSSPSASLTLSMILNSPPVYTPAYDLTTTVVPTTTTTTTVPTTTGVLTTTKAVTIPTGESSRPLAKVKTSTDSNTSSGSSSSGSSSSGSNSNSNNARTYPGESILADFARLQRNGIPIDNPMGNTIGQQLNSPPLSFNRRRGIRLYKYWVPTPISESLPSSIRDSIDLDLEKIITFDVDPDSLVNVTRAELTIKINTKSIQTLSSPLLLYGIYELQSSSSSSSSSTYGQDNTLPLLDSINISQEQNQFAVFSITEFIQNYPKQLPNSKNIRIIFTIKRACDVAPMDYNIEQEPPIGSIIVDSDYGHHSIKVFYINSIQFKNNPTDPNNNNN